MINYNPVYLHHIFIKINFVYLLPKKCVPNNNNINKINIIIKLVDPLLYSESKKKALKLNCFYKYPEKKK